MFFPFQKTLLLALLSLYFSSGFAQNLKYRKWKLRDFQGAIHSYYDFYKEDDFIPSIDIEQFKNRAKNINDFKPVGLDSFQSTIHSDFEDKSRAFSLNYTAVPYRTPREELNQNQVLRFGLIYFRNRKADLSFEWEYDNNIDSIYIFTISYKELIDELAIESSYLFNTSAIRWIVFYTGLGLGTGFSVKSKIVETFSERNEGYIIVNGQKQMLYYNGHITSENEVKAHTTYNLRAYFPFGLYIRVSENWCFFSEIRLGGSLQKVLTINDYHFRRLMSFGGGVKFDFGLSDSVIKDY